MIKKEWRVFLTAVMFLTRIPIPRSQQVDHSPEYLQLSPKYYPVVGWIIGLAGCLSFLVFSRLISVDLGIFSILATTILITGAFHEDGFADVCDGFGGGWTKEKILLIMKDSRIGAFGAIGLICMLGARFLLLRELPSFTPALLQPYAGAAKPSFYSSLPFLASLVEHLQNYRYFLLALVTAHGLSRLMPVLVIQWSAYASDPDQSKARPLANHRMRPGQLIFAACLALLPFVFLPLPFLLLILPMLYATYGLEKYFHKWIGGYTGDCLGAIQQVTELVFYIGFIVIWRYIA